MDGSTNKPREIDLVAEKSWLLFTNWNEYVELLILSSSLNVNTSHKILYFGLGQRSYLNKTLDNKEYTIRENNIYTDRHHYLSTNPK